MATTRKIEVTGAEVLRIKVGPGTRIELEAFDVLVPGYGLPRRHVEIEAEETEGGGMRISYGS